MTPTFDLGGSLLALQSAPGGGLEMLTGMLPVLIVLGIMYFLLIAPMRKRQKALDQMIQELKKGDKVVTTGGLHGEVAAVEAQAVVLKVADNVRVKVTKTAIAGRQGEELQGGAR